MSPSYDIASSALLCAEDNDTVFGFEDGQNEVEMSGQRFSRIFEPKSSELYGDFLMDFPLQSDEHFGLLVQKELEHSPRWDYTERLCLENSDLLSVRRNAIDWICKVHAHFNYGPLSAYLSVNYLDRFLANYELPQGKAWMTQLLSVACLSLAAKMEETEVPLSLDLQIGNSKYVFEAKTIQRMELLVLSTLKWRMQSVTPFSFIEFFLHKFNGGSAPDRSLFSRSAELILSIMKVTEFLVFRPSEVAAATALVVLGENQLMDIEKSMSCCIPLAKEGVLKCSEMIRDLIATRNRQSNYARTLISSEPQSPTAVLDAPCLSYKSDDAAVGSHAIYFRSTPDAKRRKICETSII